MKFQRYFKSGQQLLLKASNKKDDDRTELITATVSSLADDRLIVSLPYGDDAAEQYPFEEISFFEITAEVFGVGIKALGNFEKRLGGNRFSLQLSPDLQMFQRRISKRYDCNLGIRFSRAAKTLKTMREIWEKNLVVINKPDAPVLFEGFHQVPVNISAGGIRFTIKPPANQGELCLILIKLDDGKPPVCAIAEIVWTCTNGDNISAGMRFINILGSDQQRIDDFVKSQKIAEEKTPNS